MIVLASAITCSQKGNTEKNETFQSVVRAWSVIGGVCPCGGRQHTSERKQGATGFREIQIAQLSGDGTKHTGECRVVVRVQHLRWIGGNIIQFICEVDRTLVAGNAGEASVWHHKRNGGSVAHAHEYEASHCCASSNRVSTTTHPNPTQSQ